MTRARCISGAAAVASAAALSLPGAAGARPGDRTFAQTFPVASQLCAKVAAGTENRHLKANAVQVSSDCATLQSRFAAAQGRVLAARAAILPTLTADRAFVRAACPNPKVVGGACRNAHRLDDAAIRRLSHRLRRSYHRYFVQIEAARAQFWAAIHALRGERNERADAPIAIPPA